MRKLRDADAMLNAGKDPAAVLQALEVSQSTYEPWRSRYCGSLVVQLYNTVRPHSSLGYQPSAPVAIQPVRTVRLPLSKRTGLAWKLSQH